MTAKRPTLSDLLRETHVAPALMDRLARTVFNMGARYPTAFTTTTTGNVPASGAETAICATPALTLPYDGAIVFLWWWTLQTIGTGTTARATNIRRGTGAPAALVLNATGITATAGNVVEITGCAVDTTPGAGTPQYSVNLVGTGTTGAWTTSLVTMLAAAL